jgi:hypothetical protein
VVTVFIPEYVVGHWWEQLPAQPERAAAQDPTAVHEQRHGDLGALAADLSERVHELAEHNAPGDVRRGFLE